MIRNPMEVPELCLMVSKLIQDSPVLSINPLEIAARIPLTL
jgi:hypothetical protein